MTVRRCCCAVTEPTDLPCQDCPTGDPAPQYRVQIQEGFIKADSAGTGILGYEDTETSCGQGGCGRIEYRRKAVGNEDIVCVIYDCEGIKDDPGPYDAGDHTVIWTGCRDILTDEVNDPPANLPDILNDQEGAVRINSILACRRWDFPQCQIGGTSPSNFTTNVTVIQVDYTFTDTFTFPVYELNASNECEFQNTGTANLTQQWRCWYIKKPTAGNYYAQGAYYLARCEYPAAFNTKAGVGQPFCAINGGTVCASAYGTYPVPPTIWKPPATINLLRLL